MQENEKAYTTNQLPTYYAINETMLKVAGQVLVYIFFCSITWAMDVHAMLNTYNYEMYLSDEYQD